MSSTSFVTSIGAASHHVMGIRCDGPFQDACVFIDTADPTVPVLALALLILAVSCVDRLRRRTTSRLD